MTLLESGFAVIESCFSPAEIFDITAHEETLSGVGSRCLLDNPWCQTIAVSLRRRVASIFPEFESLGAVQCTYFDKSERNNWFVAYHQDRSVPVASTVASNDWPGWSCKEGITFVHGSDELLAQMLALRLHLDDCTIDNGPLRVFPGSHDAGTLMPQDIAAIRDSKKDRQITTGQGSLVVMRPLLLHASSKSRSMQPRRVLHFLFGPMTPPAGIQWRQIV